jgi:pimeloyl-ACP methyl ester carboxylesterase
MAGDDDPIIPVANAHAMAERIPDSRLEVFHDGGHLFLYTRGPETVAKVVDFLQS